VNLLHGIEFFLINAIYGTGLGLPAYFLLPGAADYAPVTRVVMLCLILLVVLLSRRCWCGYRYYPYYYGAYPYQHPYPYGAYTPYDPYWRARYYGYWHGYRGCYW
jgi:hypothetical protein